MKCLLMVLLCMPTLASACKLNANLLEQMIKRGEVTVAYKPNEMIVTCDTSKNKLCNQVFDYYRKHKKNHSHK